MKAATVTEAFHAIRIALLAWVSLVTGIAVWALVVTLCLGLPIVAVIRFIHWVWTW